MSERNISGFIFKDYAAVCPECKGVSFTERLIDMPLISSEDRVEADLHRVYPDARIRASLLGHCPVCNHCSWLQDFALMEVVQESTQAESSIAPSKKFALAVKSARAKNIHPLDIAYLAINGLWCAREAGESDELWLELAAYEHHKGMKEHTAPPEKDGFSHLMMGELWRQLKQFEAASEEFKLALLDANIPREIPQHQLILCQKQDFSPTALPAYLINDLYPVSSYNEANGIKQNIQEDEFAPPVRRPSQNISPVAPTAELDELANGNDNDDVSNQIPEILPETQAEPVESEEDLALAFSAKNESLPEFNIDDPAAAILNEAEVVNDRSDVIARVENYLSFSRQVYKRNWLKGFH
ncbi:MAG: hypothetical protein K2W82_07135 [Candidatus Obscuribacterales bacterium]|nr:hypothetical protein [Candidatus Obscuribacterales bacterium]